MFTWNGMELTIDLPENLWSAFRWYHLFFLSGTYGLLTHLKTLPGVHEWKRTAGKSTSSLELEFALVGMLLLRIVLGLPYRILCGAIGIIWLFVSIVATGKPSIRNNGPFKEAWRWHMSPEDIYGCM